MGGGENGGHGKRGWRKLHLRVNRSGGIVAEALTDATTADAVTGITLMGAVDGDVASVTGDTAYDTIAFYDAATAHGAKVVVPPARTARLSRRRPRSKARDHTKFRSLGTARGRVAHLAAYFGRDARATVLTTYQMRQYQRARRAAGAAPGTINRETSALHRMLTLAVHWGWLATVPGFPDRLRENPPRQGFFEHPEYLAVRAQLPAPWQDVLDVAYYSGWRKHEILFLTWEEIDGAGGVIRLSPARSKTRVGRILPISPPIAEALARRRARRDPHSPLVFHRDGIPIRRWRTAWRTRLHSRRGANPLPPRGNGKEKRDLLAT